MADVIGGDDNLEVSLSRYEPRVQCGRPMPRSPGLDDCQSLLDAIHVSAEVVTFGDVNNPYVDVKIPLVITERTIYLV